MQTYLHQLAKQILLAEQSGISKVRFAKTIYFVHKGLVKNNLVSNDELAFIRMPLGPVPVDFMELETAKGISADNRVTGLSYDAKVYNLTESVEQDEAIYPFIKDFLPALRRSSTSQLVEISHQEPSWIMNPNGSRYHISDEDLSNPLPGQTQPSRVDQKLDDQHLQAQLIKGMMADIVEESTSLEYPD